MSKIMVAVNKFLLITSVNRQLTVYRMWLTIFLLTVFYWASFGLILFQFWTGLWLTLEVFSHFKLFFSLSHGHFSIKN
jgi:hypothetical protein